MRLAIISDSHYPWNLTKLTILASRFGYNEQFYVNLDSFYDNIDAKQVKALIFNGDFGWDLFLFPFIREVLEKIDPMWFFYPLVQLAIVREHVDAKIPLIFTEGNHDFWFHLVENQLNDKGFGELHLNIIKFRQYLTQFALSRSKITQIVEALLGYYTNLPGVENSTILIAKNVILLRNSGIKIENVLMYGMPWYEKKNPPVPWTAYKKKLVEDYHVFIMKNNNLTLPNKIVIFHHRNPPTLNFVQEFADVNLHSFCYGHWHGIRGSLVEKYKIYGPGLCVMPERNNFHPLILDL